MACLRNKQILSLNMNHCSVCDKKTKNQFPPCWSQGEAKLDPHYCWDCADTALVIGNEDKLVSGQWCLMNYSNLRSRLGCKDIPDDIRYDHVWSMNASQGIFYLVYLDEGNLEYEKRKKAEATGKITIKIRFCCKDVEYKTSIRSRPFKKSGLGYVPY